MALNDKLINYGNLAEFHSQILNDTGSTTGVTWSANKIITELASKQDTLSDGQNINITDNKINALGYGFNGRGFAEIPSIRTDAIQEFPYPLEQLGLNDLQLTGDAGATTYTMGGNSAAVMSQMGTQMIQMGVMMKTANSEIAKITSINTTNSTITFESTLDANNALSNAVVTNLYIPVIILISGDAGATTYTYTSQLPLIFDIGDTVSFGNYPLVKVIGKDTSNTTVTFDKTLDENDAVSNAQFKYSLSKNNTASAACSHAEGAMTSAYGVTSHAEGNTTTASGTASHAEGANTTASGEDSHAEGSSTTASGVASHAEGSSTITQNYCEHAEGRSNVSHKTGNTAGDTRHSVGIGTGSSSQYRKNAFEIMENGDMYVYGVGGYQGTDTHVQNASIKTLQDVITDINTSVAGKQDTLVAGDGIDISGNTISCNVEPLQAGDNISVENGRINALGYKFDSNIPSFVSNYYKVEEPFESELEPSMMGFEELTFTGDANATTYTVGGSSASMFFQFFGSMPPEYLSIYGLKINGIKGFCQSFDSANSQVTLTATVSPNAAISASPLQAIVSVVTATLSGSANATTYTVTDETGSVLESLNEKLDYNLELEVENYGTFVVDSIDVTGNTITFKETLDASNAVSNALLVKNITDSNVASGEDSYAEGYKSLASGLNSHAEGENCKATSQDSHAEGQETVASGIVSHAEGYETKALGHYSHAEGQLTKTSNIAEHAEGFNNVSHNLGNNTKYKTISSIGIGDSLNSKNGFEIMCNGDLYLYGIGGYDGVHIKHETGYESVKTLQEYIASLEARIAALEGKTTVE